MRNPKPFSAREEIEFQLLDVDADIVEAVERQRADDEAAEKMVSEYEKQYWESVEREMLNDMMDEFLGNDLDMLAERQRELEYDCDDLY